MIVQECIGPESLIWGNSSGGGGAKKIGIGGLAVGKGVHKNQKKNYTHGMG